MTKIYMAVPFEPHQGHHVDMALIFSTEADAKAYCEKCKAEDDYLEWEVEEFIVDEDKLRTV